MKYFEQQVYPPHVDYFYYDHMNNIIKLVTSSTNGIDEKGEYGQSDLLEFLNSHITIDEIQKAIRKLKAEVLMVFLRIFTSMVVMNSYHHAFCCLIPLFPMENIHQVGPLV